MVSRPAMDRLAGLRNQPEPEPNWCILNLPRLSGQSARIKTNGVGSLLAGLFGLVIFLNAVTGLLAQSVWTNLAVGAWGVAANWSPNGIPNAMDAVVTTANVLIVTTNVNGSGTFPYTFGTLNCGSGPLGTASGASPSAQLKAAVSSGTPVINVASGGTFFYSMLNGAQGFNKTGAGELTFRYNSYAQPFTGNVTISAGMLTPQQDSSLGNATNAVIIADGAMLNGKASINNQTLTVSAARKVILNAAGGAAQLGTYAFGYTNAVMSVISESAAGSGLTITGQGAVLLGGVNTYTGPTIISSGTLTIGGAGQLGGGAYAANIAIAKNTAFIYNSTAAQTLSGVISGAGPLMQNGPGTLTLAAANTYSNATLINAGTLALGTGGSLPAGSTVILGAGGTFDVSGLGVSATYTLGADASLTASGSTVPAILNGGTSGTVNLGTRPITLNFDGVNPALVISSGTLSLGGQTITVNTTNSLTHATYNLIQVNSGRLVHSGGFTLAGTATNGATGIALGFTTNAGVAYVQMIITAYTNIPPPVLPPLNLVPGNNRNLNLSWSASSLGGVLWSQTNLLNPGLGANWYPWSNSSGATNVSIPLNQMNPAVFFRLSSGYYASYNLTNMLTNWDGHYELGNTNIPTSKALTNISDTAYTWAIIRGSNAFSFVVDNEGSGPIQTNGVDLKSRAELYVPMHYYTNGQPNRVQARINYVIPTLTDYGSNNNPYWVMQVYHPTGKPMCLLSLDGAGTPAIGVYTYMQADGTAAGEVSTPFTLVNAPYTALGDVRSTNGFVFSFQLDFNSDATTSMAAQITLASDPTNVYQAVFSVPMQSALNPFTDGSEFYLKFGSYNAGGTHHHAKVTVGAFDMWSETPFPVTPVRGVGTYYIPALQRQTSAGNYNNLSIQ